jgi:hypothetical protein
MGEKSYFMQTKAIYQNISWQEKKGHLIGGV